MLLTYSGVLLAALYRWGTQSRAASAEELTQAGLEGTLSSATKGDTMVVLPGPDGLLYLAEDDFAHLRLHLPETQAHEHDGHRYYAPAAIKGCSVAIDEARQRAVISAPAWALEATHLSAADRQHPSITPAPFGGFFNYQVSAQQINGETLGGVYGELGVFGGAGVLTNSLVGRAAARQEQLIRLDTTFTGDFADSLDTLVLGDAVS